MNSLTVQSFAKVNLFLEIVQKRGDGLHNIQSVMQNISLSDTIELTRIEEGFEMDCNDPEMDVGESNLITKAVRVLERETGKALPVKIHLKKRIPVGAGLGGGSSDAAATLTALNLMYDIGCDSGKLAQTAFDIGCDVPFFITGGTALVEGAGERVKRVAGLPRDFWFVLSKPPLALSTSSAYELYDQSAVYPSSQETTVVRPSRLHSTQRSVDPILATLSLGDFEEIGKELFNRFEDVILSRATEISKLKAVFAGAGAKQSNLTGSGPTVYSIFRNKKDAEMAYHFMKIYFRETFLVRPVGTSFRIANFS